MIGIAELFDEIQARNGLLYRDIPGLDIDELARLLGPRLVQTSGKNYAFATHKEDPSDCSDRTEYFDWHSDGLYHARPPRFVFLHCIDPGAGQCKTELANVSKVLSLLNPSSLNTLLKLRSHYIGHGDSFDHPVLRTDGMLLASRGHVSALSDLPLAEVPTIRDTAAAWSDLYRHLDENAVSFVWLAGGTLIFDQRKYMHRRNSAVIDRARKLIRMWFD